MTLDRLVAGVFGSAALAFLIEVALKGTFLLAVAALLVLALRRGSAAHRHLVWACALAGLVALPVMLALLPAWRVSAPALAWLASGVSAPAPTPSQTPFPTPAPYVAAPVTPAPSAIEPPAPTGAAITPGHQAPASRPEPQPRITWQAVAFTLWAIGAIAVLAIFVAGHAMLRLLLRGARPVRDGEWHALSLEAADQLGLTLPFALLRGEGVLVPVALGLLRPRVLLPAMADQWPLELRRAVLLHELAHVQRHDCLTQAVAQIACALFWFHPGVWWAAARLQIERERACDDRVLAGRTRASDYADHLLGMVRALRATRLAALGAVAFARPSSLEGRLLAVLDPGRNRRAVGWRVAAPAAALAALVLLPFAALEPVDATTVYGDRSWRQDLNVLRPSRVTPVPDAGQTLEARVAWAQTDAARAQDGVWWIGWSIETSERNRNGSLLHDTGGISTELLGWRGAFTLDDVLAGREQGTNAQSDRSESGSEPAALLLRMTSGGPERVRVQSRDLPADFRGEPLYWLDIVPEDQAFAWLRATTERARDERMRSGLVESISFMENSKLVVPYLTTIFRGSGSPQVRANAAEGLARHPSPEGVRLLADAARTDPSPRVRRACAEALGRFQTPEALDALLAIARASEGPERRAAFNALGDEVSRQAPAATSKKAKPPTVDKAPPNEASDVTRHEKESKHEQKAAKETAWDTGPADEPSQPMPAAEREVQRQAIESLARYPQEQSLQLLWRIAETSPDGDLRANAVESLGRLGTPAALSLLDQIAWKNRQSRARQAAVEQMRRRFPPDQALDKLMAIGRSHPSRETRRMAVEELGRIDSPRTLEALEQIIANGPDVDTQRQAAESIGRLNREGVEDRLAEISRTHPSIEVRRQAVESLGRRKGGEIPDRLMTIARAQGHQDVQRQAVESLGRIRDPRTRGMLLELATSHPSVEVERQAVESLARLKEDVMADLAQIARTHPSPDVRRQAVESMTRRDPDQALPLLEEILRQPKKGSGT